MRGVRLLLVLAVVAAGLLAVAPPATAQLAQADDAGSGRDAGRTFQDAVPIAPGAIYTAALNNSVNGWSGTPGFNLVGDSDWFTFEVRQGQRISAELSGSLLSGCMTVVAPDGATIGDAECTGSIRNVVAPVAGTYALTVSYFVVDEQPYEFGVGVDAPAPVGADMGVPSSDGERGQVVVAVADTGVNPYHEIYHRPENTAHPCTWVAGFDDCSIPALELSIGQYDTFQEAYEADRAVWASLAVGQWYWIPRTNIIGAVCDGSGSISHSSQICILDEDGHGTGTTSSVLSEAPDALLLVHDGNSGASGFATAPVVPDLQSHSWGPAAPLPLHAADPAWKVLTGSPLFTSTGSFGPRTIFFIAAGNGAPFPTFLDSSRVHPDVQVVGGGYPGHWTPSSWASFDFASWFCRPTAVPDDVRAYRASFCGTSFSTPTAAGTAAAALREIRLRDGTTGRGSAEMVSDTVSRAAFLDALRSGATYTAEPGRFRNRPALEDPALPSGQEHLFWGYGWLDRTRVGAVVACALDAQCPAKSAQAEQYNAARRDVRAASTGGGA